MDKLISVIVPIYNVEEYLCRCVDNLINQTYSNLEIILVDDGSPDNCGRICDEYAKKDSRIKVVHKKNGGLSDARNAGMKIATGEYISFIDSDDYISLETYDKMLHAAVTNEADIVECNVNYDYNGRIEKYNHDKYAVYTDNYSIVEAYIKYYHIKTVVWNKLYKKSLLEGIEFEFGKYNEDEFFTYRVLAKANKYVHLEDYLYFYYQRSSSIMGTYTLKRLDMVDAMRERVEFIKGNYPDLYKYQTVCFCTVCIFHYQMLLKNKKIIGNRDGRQKVKKYRSEFKLKYSDLKNINFINKVSLYLSNCKIGFEFITRLRNLFGYGL